MEIKDIKENDIILTKNGKDYLISKEDNDFQYKVYIVENCVCDFRVLTYLTYFDDLISAIEYLLKNY